MRIQVAALRLMAGLLTGAPATVQAGGFTGMAGGSQPFNNMQPSIALHTLLPLSGPFHRVGEVRLFAGTRVPEAVAPADGALLPISENEAMFVKLGTRYGGDGEETFGVPDLRGRVIAHAGTGIGLTNRPFGTSFGAANVGVGLSNLPAHQHTLPNGTTSARVGSSLPLTNVQPSMGLDYRISLQGVYPSQLGSGDATSGDSIVGEPFLGQVRITAGSGFHASGDAPTDGQLLTINQNQALYSLLGNTYGGNNQMFALPDLRGRTAVHANNSTASPARLGQQLGTETVTLNADNLPTHHHPLEATGGLVSGSTGAGQTFDNRQPSLGLNYIVCLQGYMPTGMYEGAVLGEVAIIAGNVAPAGWAFAEGQLLPISQNTALFYVLGTTYGGNGHTTFALPDLRGKSVIGAGGGWQLGGTYGLLDVALTEANLPAHQHYTPIAVVPGDADTDEDVDFGDLLILARHYGLTEGQTWATGDFTADGKVLFDDLLSLARCYGRRAPLGASQLAQLGEDVAADWQLAQSLVPEPAAVSLVGLAGLALRRRRH